MRGRRITVVAIALAGSMSMLLVGTAFAASTQTSLRTKGKEVKKTGYKLKLSSTTQSVIIDLNKSYKKKGLKQHHRFGFDMAKMAFSKNLKKGLVRSGKKMGDFGKIRLAFQSTEPMKVKKTCGGEIITRTRTGTLTGTFMFKPDTHGISYFKKIRFGKFKTTIKKVTHKNCQTISPDPCPNEVVVFTGGIRAGMLGSGAITMSVSVPDTPGPAKYIYRTIQARTKDPSKMSHASDLSLAVADFSVGSPLLAGDLSIIASGPMEQVQTGACKGGKQWSSEARPGTVSGSVTAHFDSYGDAVVSPSQGTLQRWVTQ